MAIPVNASLAAAKYKVKTVTQSQTHCLTLQVIPLPKLRLPDLKHDLDTHKDRGTRRNKEGQACKALSASPSSPTYTPRNQGRKEEWRSTNLPLN